MIIIVIGVSGAGKSTIGSALANRLGYEFLDGDDWHPPENVAKMAAGIPLEDSDRWPWLDRLNRLLRERNSAVLACSALKQAYRDRLAASLAHCEFVYLQGSFDLIRERIAARQHRYMPDSLLASQFAVLEVPANALAIDVAAEVTACVDAIASGLGLRT